MVSIYEVADSPLLLEENGLWSLDEQVVMYELRNEQATRRQVALH